MLTLAGMLLVPATASAGARCNGACKATGAVEREMYWTYGHDVALQTEVHCRKSSSHRYSCSITVYDGDLPAYGYAKVKHSGRRYVVTTMRVAW